MCLIERELKHKRSEYRGLNVRAMALVRQGFCEETRDQAVCYNVTNYRVTRKRHFISNVTNTHS